MRDSWWQESHSLGGGKQKGGKAPSAASWGTGRWQGWLPGQFTVPARGTLNGPQQAVGFGSFSSPLTVQIFKN